MFGLYVGYVFGNFFSAVADLRRQLTDCFFLQLMFVKFIGVRG